MKKNIAWIDTIRVLASFLIIFSHYFMCAGFMLQPSLRNRAFEAAILGVALFFAISGYLIHPSLERTPSLKDFFKKKLVRIVVPFTVCYIVLSCALTVLSLLEPKMIEKVPLYYASFGAKYFYILLGMFPVDLNVTKFLGIEVDWFVGEWFIGVIIWMYLLSPFLDKCALRAPILSLAVSLIISYVAYGASIDLMAQDRIHASWGLFIVRVPEFLFGIILFIHREKLLRLRKYLLPVTGIYMAANVAYFVFTYPPQGAIFFPSSPTCFATTLPAIYLCFTAAEILNEHANKILDWFNSFNGISYMAMLTQHIIIYAFEAAIPFQDLHSFGKIYILLMITWVTILVSVQIKKFSDPTENFFLKKS